MCVCTYACVTEGYLSMECFFVLWIEIDHKSKIKMKGQCLFYLG